MVSDSGMRKTKIKGKKTSDRIDDPESIMSTKGRKKFKTSSRKLRSGSMSVTSECSTTSSSDSESGALDTTVVENELTSEEVENNTVNRVNLNKIRTRLTKALFSCVSSYKLKLPSNERESFEDDMCEILAIASELTDTVVESSGYIKACKDMLKEVTERRTHEKITPESNKEGNDNVCLTGVRNTVLESTEFPPLKTVKKRSYAVVLSSEDPNKNAKEVEETFRQIVHPAAGNARVNNVVPMRNGGIKVLLPSKDERDAIQRMASTASGLKASVRDRLGPRIMAYNVNLEVSNKDLLSNLYRHEFADTMSEENFNNSIKVVSRQIFQKRNTVNVLIEAAKNIVDIILESGRVYINSYSYRVTEYNVLPHCYRCLSRGHRLAECNVKEIVCSRCSEEGHKAVNCKNEVNCRVCQKKGVSSGHYMISVACPSYARALETTANY